MDDGRKGQGIMETNCVCRTMAGGHPLWCSASPRAYVPEAPSDVEIDRAFDLALIEHGDQGEMANLQATVAVLRERTGWDEAEAEAVFRCGVQVLGWNWNDYGRFAQDGGAR